MSPVDFKKWSCPPVEFRGEGPHFNRVMEGIIGRRVLSDVFILI